MCPRDAVTAYHSVIVVIEKNAYENRLKLFNSKSF